MVCKNCAAPINPQSVGMPGGCNPMPLKARRTADAVIISGGGHRGGPALVRADNKHVVRLVYESFRRQEAPQTAGGRLPSRWASTVATAMIAVATDIGDKINRELRTIGANLIVTPQEDTLDVEMGGVNLKPPSDGAFLNEADLPKIRGTFWHNNIVGFSPMLPVTVKASRGNVERSGCHAAGNLFRKALHLRQGRVHYRCAHHASLVESFMRRWQWSPSCTSPADDSENVLLGERLAAKLNLKAGDTIESPGGNSPLPEFSLPVALKTIRSSHRSVSRSRLSANRARYAGSTSAR